MPVEIVGRDEDLKPADKPDEKKVSAPLKTCICAIFFVPLHSKIKAWN